MVNFVSMFCPELQKLLKPIYDLTKKGKPFLWGKEQQEAFEEIKTRVQNPPVLSMPDRKGRFILYSDTSKLATGSMYYINSKMENPGLLPMQARECLKQQRIIPLQSSKCVDWPSI